MQTRHQPIVSDYMSASPIVVHPEQSVLEAAEIMEAEEIRHLPVVGDGELKGLLSQRDIQILQAVKNLDLDGLSIEDVLQGSPYSVRPDTPISFVARHMARLRYGSAVVVDKGEVVGIFTTVDALRALDELVTASEVEQASLRA